MVVSIGTDSEAREQGEKKEREKKMLKNLKLWLARRSHEKSIKKFDRAFEKMNRAARL